MFDRSDTLSTSDRQERDFDSSVVTMVMPVKSFAPKVTEIMYH